MQRRSLVWVLLAVSVAFVLGRRIRDTDFVHSPLPSNTEESVALPAVIVAETNSPNGRSATSEGAVSATGTVDLVASLAASNDGGHDTPEVQAQDDEPLREWSGEPADANASTELGDYIEQALIDVEVSGKLLDVACGKTLCRVHMRFENLNDVQRFSEEATVADQRKRIDIRTDEEDGVMVDVVVSRTL